MNIINTIYEFVDFYELPTVYCKQSKQSIVLPKNMYKMPVIYQTSHKSDPKDTQIESNRTTVLIENNDFKDVDKELALNPLKDLISRQELLLNRLQVLDNGLQSMASVSSPHNSDTFETKNSRNGKYKSTNRLAVCSPIGCSNEVLDSIKDVVVFSDVNRIPVSVLSVIKLMRSLGLKVLLKIHFHSSLDLKTDSHLDYLNQSLSLIDLNYNSNNNSVERRLDNDLILTLIFKDISEHKMILCPNESISITSEANILRFMARIAAKLKPELNYLYEGIEDILRLTAVDTFVDEINAKIFVNSVNKTNYYLELDSILSQNKYLCGKSPTIADLLLWSGLNQRVINPKLTIHLEKWFNTIKQFILTPNQLF